MQHKKPHFILEWGCIIMLLFCDTVSGFCDKLRWWISANICSKWSHATSYRGSTTHAGLPVCVFVVRSSSQFPKLISQFQELLQFDPTSSQQSEQLSIRSMSLYLDRKSKTKVYIYFLVACASNWKLKTASYFLEILIDTDSLLHCFYASGKVQSVLTLVCVVCGQWLLIAVWERPCNPELTARGSGATRCMTEDGLRQEPSDTSGTPRTKWY